ncbi:MULTISPECIES: PQQ-dependent sugar dehydrogenase [Bacillaceae]|uniref:PQQ-dependent sugar dehydrogenase n=1 Tax=Shouchella TaxID=2893057 RepID=UPI001F3295D4|nr:MULTISPECIES: PQQ-dependent sugar dehydrogenase [Bacillaceae]
MSQLKKIMMTLGGSFLLVACNTVDDEEMTDITGDASDDNDRTESVVEVEETVMAENLQSPWTIVKDESRFFIPKREGTIYRIDENEEITEETVQLNEEVIQEAESGLLGMVLDPDFTSNGYAYAYHSYEGAGTAIENRIVRLEWNEAEDEWTENAVLLDGIPGAPTHNGGRLAIGPDGYLYATTGDAEEVDLAQDQESLAGSILRMELDGAIPEDNPFDGSLVYSYGHRNPQGLTWLQDGTMYSSEHGASGHDELNVIEAGNNYGWPVIEGDEEEEGMETPIIHSGQDTWAPSGITTDEDVIYTAGLRGEAVYLFNPEEPTEWTEYVSDYGRVRDVMIEGNDLYFITNNTDGRGNPESEDDRLIHMELN